MTETEIQQYIKRFYTGSVSIFSHDNSLPRVDSSSMLLAELSGTENITQLPQLIDRRPVHAGYLVDFLENQERIPEAWRLRGLNDRFRRLLFAGTIIISGQQKAVPAMYRPGNNLWELDIRTVVTSDDLCVCVP